MSFASEVKAELCRESIGSRTLAVAECSDAVVLVLGLDETCGLI